MEDIEDIEINDIDHDKLLAAVAKLDKTQHIKRPTRNEPTNLNSEFNLNKSSNKLDIKEVVKVLENTARHVQIGKKLKKTQEPRKVLTKPLEKPQAERIKRSIGYEQTKTKLGRWNAVVARSRTVDYVSFPLKSHAIKLQPTKDFLSKLKSKSPLELELDEIDPPAVEEKEDEEEQPYPLSYQEMLEHRQHLAKIRAQQSFKAAKDKRQSKIKSKKYHRVLKKERLKKQFTEFEELQKTNPEEALKKLEALEKARALERHTLRHKNTGKWAKSKLVRAKYDKEVRQQLAEQLSVSRGLTQKTQVESSGDESDDKDIIQDFTLSQNPLQPWMLMRSDKLNSNGNAEFDFGYKKYFKGKSDKRKESDSDTDNNNELEDTKSTLTGGLETKVQTINESAKQQKGILKQLKLKSTRAGPIIEELLAETNVGTTGDITKLTMTKTAKKKSSEKNDTRELRDMELEDFSSRNVGDMASNVNELNKTKASKKKPKENKGIENISELEFKNYNLKSIIDEPLEETDSRNILSPKQGSQQVRILNIPESNQETSKDIKDSPRIIKGVSKPTYLRSSLPQIEDDSDGLDDDEEAVSKLNMEGAFQDEEIVDSFRQEKKDEANQDNPLDNNSTLPGWGSWGGKGVPKKRKSSRIIFKPAPKMPRRDENKGDIIIKEYKDPKLSAHKVTDVPFPFTTVKDYEASIRAPLGNTFIPERAHQKLIKPSVITKIGTIIEPMDEDELLAPKNLNFKKQSILKFVDKR